MIRTVFISLGTLVVGLAIGIPLLGTIFSAGGSFDQIEAIAAGTSAHGVDGTGLAGNRYSGVLIALAALIPLFVGVYFIMRFGGVAMIEKIGSWGGGGSRRRRRSRRRSSGRRRSAPAAPAATGVPGISPFGR